ncbi:MAG: hypothetical protein OEZ06_19315 [Myxococcales bacterium]|nr:hypothetical protein [Myxococcales bacterium]
MTRLELDLKPAPSFINERIPVLLGITAESDDPASEATENVVVLVSFVDADDPSSEATACSSNGLDLELVGDGTEHTYEVVIWPITECAELIGKKVALRVEIDPEEETSVSSEPLLTNEASASSPANKACQGPDPGCVHELELAFGPADADGETLVDVDFVGFSSESSVAVLPQQLPPGQMIDPARPEDPRPALSVHTRLLLNGRHPYESAVDPDALPEDLTQAEPEIVDGLTFGRQDVDTLDDLPGTVRLRYEISAASDGQDWLPLSVGTGSERALEVQVDELTPGTPNDFTHDLHLEGDTLAAVTGTGVWAQEDTFVVRGCFTTDFEQLRPVPEEGECRSLDVMLIEDTGVVESGAASLSLTQVARFSHGGSRIGAVAEFKTENVLDVNKISALGQAELRLKGKIGRSFDIQIFNAFGSLEAPFDGDGTEVPDEDPTNSRSGDPATATSGKKRKIPDGVQDGNVTLFGIEVFSNRSVGADIEEDDPFTISRSQLIFAGRFGFGPVGLAFDFHAGGQAGLNATAGLGLFVGEGLCTEAVPVEADAPAVERCITLDTTIEPFVSLTAEAFGGVDARVVKAGVVVDLTIARFGLPLQSSLSLGQDTSDQFLVHAGVGQDLTFLPLAGELKLVGTIRFFRKKVSRSVTIVSFQTQEMRQALFSRVLPGAQVVGQ